MSVYNFSEPAVECFDCQIKDEKLENIQYWVRALNEHLYGMQELDSDLLEHCMIELAHLANVRLTDRPINVKRKEPKASIQPITDWIQFNNKYLKQL